MTETQARTAEKLRHGEGPQPATRTQLDRDLAQQLELLIDSEVLGGGQPLRPALIEALFWAVGSIGVWLVTWYFG